jgi:hypothetical protein
LFDSFEHGAHAPIAHNTKRRQFRMCAWELSAGTDSHYEAAFRDAVERGQRVRQRERVAEQRQQDGRPQPDASRRAGHGGEEY